MKFTLTLGIQYLKNKMKLARRHCVINREGSSGHIIHEEGRETIRLWRDSRRRERGKKSAFIGFWVYSFNKETLRHFMLNFNFMVFIQVFIALASVFAFQFFDVAFEIHLILLVSPIVFPLAFSIVTDFQRREKVLEDLGLFKSSTMMWFFCMREWQKGAGKDGEWLDAVHAKLKSLLFHLHEYLLTDLHKRRAVIIRVLYEDFSDCSQLVEEIRQSKLPANTAIVSRAIGLISDACLAFERLRVIREYRSPRSIRSFNKVFIMLFPVILAPHFIFKAREDKCDASAHSWKPYYMTIIVTVVFSILQGVQDTLDDPFDGLSEDDINLEVLQEWNSHYMKHTKNRFFDIQRFRKKHTSLSLFNDDEDNENKGMRNKEGKKDSLIGKPSVKKGLQAATEPFVFASLTSIDDTVDADMEMVEEGVRSSDMKKELYYSSSVEKGLKTAARNIVFAPVSCFDDDDLQGLADYQDKSNSKEEEAENEHDADIDNKELCKSANCSNNNHPSENDAVKEYSNSPKVVSTEDHEICMKKTPHESICMNGI